nr:hypothetical protein [Tanacetum cinerariifolium]
WPGNSIGAFGTGNDGRTTHLLNNGVRSVRIYHYRWVGGGVRDNRMRTVRIDDNSGVAVLS